MMSWVTPFCVWCQSRGSGKALSLDTKIPTPTGFKTMGELKVGDYILDNEGKPTRVTYVSDIFLGNKCYEIEFEDGEKIIADADHLWYVMTPSSSKSFKKPPKPTTKRPCKVHDKIDENGYLVVATKDMVNDYFKIRKEGYKEYKYRVPIQKPVEYEHKDLILHPYVLGVWLGDGASAGVRITCDEKDIDNMVANLEACGVKTKVYKNKNRASSIGLDIGVKRHKNKTKEALKKLNLINNKHIPKDYLFSSIEQRYELLRGLMDTDGSCAEDGECEFVQKDHNLILQFSQLLSSLGIKHSIKPKIIIYNNKPYVSYRVCFRVDKAHSCFKLKRKHEKLKDKLNIKHLNKAIVSIREVPSVPTRCIQVDSPKGLYLCGERFTVTHNTTLIAPFVMAKTNLIPNFQVYIMSGVGSQAQEAFLKIEKIAKREIASFTGLTDVFYNETVKSAANTDGFTHNPASFQYKLYNGSAVNSLNGAFDNNRSKRSNLNVYDESGFAPEELFVTSLPFITQDSNFKLGGDIDVTLMPKQFPNQAIFASSASSTDTYFYKVYRDYAKKMFLGDKRYFVADINAEVVINATYNGKPYPVPLLKQSDIEDAMKKNKEKALREYYNKFSTEGGENQAVKRATIIRNSEVRIPLLYNPGNKKFAIAYDPARSYDNSVALVGEIYYDDEIGYKMRICNGVSFIDVSKKKKTPMRTPEQVDYIKQMLLDYNGKNAADYENIEALLIDAGAGGGGHILADYFMEDWVDSQGRTHRGLIDKIESADYVSKFPNAIDKLKLMNPKKYKNEMYDALVEMLGLDLISFTAEYDMKGYLSLFEDAEVEYEDNNKNKTKDIRSEQKIYKLSFDEELALKNIDLAKEELVNIYRFDNPSGGYRYNLSPDKESKMNDDRAYCLAMLAWYLQQLRRKHITHRKNNNNLDTTKLFNFRQPQIRKI